MIKFAPIRVARSLSSEAQFKGGAISAVSAIKQSVPQIVHNTPTPVVNNGPVAKFLISNFAGVRTWMLKFMLPIKKNLTPVIKKQGKKTLETIKTGSKSLSNSYLETAQKIDSKFNGFVENFEKLTKSSKATKDATKETISEIKGFVETDESKNIVNYGKETVSKAKKEENFFDRLKDTTHEKPTSLNEVPNKTHQTKMPHSEKPKSSQMAKKSPEAVHSEEKLKTAKPKQKSLENVTPKTVEQQKHSKPNHTNTPKVSSNPFAEKNLTKTKNSQTVSFLDKTVAEKAPRVSKTKNPYTKVVAKDSSATKSNLPKSNFSKIHTVKNNIKLIKTKIAVAEQLNLNTKILKAELAKKEISLAKLVKSAKKKNIKLEQSIKTKRLKKYRKLSKNNYVGHKSFDSIKGKGGLFKKEQYSPDGKLERTVINKGKGLIEIREADSNEIYYMRNGIKIKKSDMEAQEDTMKKLAFAVNMAGGKTEIQGLVRSYAKKCGMKKVNKRIMIEGKTTNIIYEGFGYSITADGRVLSKKFSYGNNVFYSDISAGCKRAEHKKA